MTPRVTYRPFINFLYCDSSAVVIYMGMKGIVASRVEFSVIGK